MSADHVDGQRGGGGNGELAAIGRDHQRGRRVHHALHLPIDVRHRCHRPHPHRLIIIVKPSRRRAKF